MEKNYFFNVDCPDFYMYNKPENKQRTRDRLIEMAELGMEETGFASFGIRNIMSGLYIEMVWSKTDEDFADYLDWVRSLITKKSQA